MVTFRDLCGYRPSQARRILRHLNNQLNPNPSRPSQSPYAGSEVRLLTSVPPEIFGDIGIPIHQVGAHSTTVEASHPSPAQESQVLAYPVLSDPASGGGSTRPPVPHFPPPLPAPDPSCERSPRERAQRVEGPQPRLSSAPKLSNPNENHIIETPAPPEPTPESYPEIDSELALPHPEETETPESNVGAGLRPARISPRRNKPETPVSLTHHEAHCTVCRHPDRDAIEQCFLHWQRPSSIAYEFQLTDRRVVYRHARALGLYQQRATRARRSLEFIMEQAETVKATADSVIRAVKAHACIDENGRWTEPVKRTIITHQYVGSPDPAMTRLDDAASLAGGRSEGPLGLPPNPAPRRNNVTSRTNSRRPPAASAKISRHTCRDISAANPATSTKVRKYLGTLAHRITMGILPALRPVEGRANNACPPGRVSRRISPQIT